MNEKGFLLLIILLFVLPSQRGICQMTALESDVQILTDLLDIFYVSNPNDPTVQPILLGNKEISNGIEKGEFWVNGSIKNAQELVRSLLRDGTCGGDQPLQMYAAKIVKLTNKPVQIWLYDDTNGPLNAVAMQLYNPCPDMAFYIWPCANNTSEDPLWAGYMHLGAKNMDTFGLKWTKSTFLHELVHTQDQSDLRGHLFYVAGKDWSYGEDEDHYLIKDGGHYLVEAVPNLAMTYKEGIANTFSHLYNAEEAARSFNWFANNDYLVIEMVGSGGTGAIAPDAAFLYDKIKLSAGPGLQLSDPAFSSYRAYKIRDLPPEFLVHNEQILALIFSEFVKYQGLSTFLQALQRSNNELLGLCASGVAVLFKRMCEESAQTNRNTGKIDLLPLAYADYFTAYRSGENKELFSRFFEGMLPNQLIESYWYGKARAAVRAAAPITSSHKPRKEDLLKIALALGITPNREN